MREFFHARGAGTSGGPDLRTDRRSWHSIDTAAPGSPTTMSDSRPRATGWSLPKALGLVVGVVGMAGFGFCSLCGLAVGAQSREMIGVALLFAVPGLAIAVLCFLLARKMVRLARAPRE